MSADCGVAGGVSVQTGCLRFRSPTPEQTKTATDSPHLPENSRRRHLDGQEASRERREKNRYVEAAGRRFGKGAVKRQVPETAPTLAFRAEKSPTDKGWALSKWWWILTANGTEYLHSCRYVPIEVCFSRLGGGHMREPLTFSLR